ELGRRAGGRDSIGVTCCAGAIVAMQRQRRPTATIRPPRFDARSDVVERQREPSTASTGPTVA
ncbi:MAG: hypothetical protein M3Z16_02890, partial [Pseudomonadota bacterium]|nr:hypothetical protein [Pseudomonadota bacterium]